MTGVQTLLFRSVEGWGADEAILIFIGPSVNEPNNGKGILGYCATDDLARILLMWSGTQPSWQMSFTLPEISLKEMMGRLIDHPFPSHVDGDTAISACLPKLFLSTKNKMRFIGVKANMR